MPATNPAGLGAARRQCGRRHTPGLADYDTLVHALTGVENDYPIVTICACPQDAGAVHAAQSLQKLGYYNALPLRGGFDACKAAQG